MKIFKITAFLIMISSAAFAHEGTIHYKGEVVTSSAQAVKVLNAKIAEINQITLKKKLSGKDLETIHKISYSLETASDRLAEEHANNASVDEIAEAVQALHYSSEKRKEKETREWFAKLQVAVKKLKI